MAPRRKNPAAWSGRLAALELSMRLRSIPRYDQQSAALIRLALDHVPPTDHLWSRPPPMPNTPGAASNSDIVVALQRAGFGHEADVATGRAKPRDFNSVALARAGIGTRQNPMPPALAEMRLGVAAARKALAGGQHEKARQMAQAAIDAARGIAGDAKLRAKLAELGEAARYVMAHAAPRRNPFAVGDRVVDDYGRRGIVHRKLPQNSYDVVWTGYGGRAMRAKEEALRRANPRVRYYVLPASNFVAGTVWEQGDILYARPEQYRVARGSYRPGKQHVRGAFRYLPPGRYVVLNFGEWRSGPLYVAPQENP